MSNMKILTRQEQLLLGCLNDLTVVDIATIKDINRSLHITTNSNLLKTLHNLIKKSVLLNLKKGTYYVVKPGSRADVFSMARYVFEGYLGLETALFVYGAKSDYPINIQIITPGNRYLKKTVGNTIFVGIPFRRLCYGAMELDGKLVSSRAKTLFDCMYHIDLVKDYGSILRLVRMLSKKDLEEFVMYADRLNQIVFYERSGYMLNAAHAPKWVLEYLRKRTKSNAVVASMSTTISKQKGTFIKSWSIYDNIGIQKL